MLCDLIKYPWERWLLTLRSFQKTSRSSFGRTFSLPSTRAGFPGHDHMLIIFYETMHEALHSVFEQIVLQRNEFEHGDLTRFLGGFWIFLILLFIQKCDLGCWFFMRRFFSSNSVFKYSFVLVHWFELSVGEDPLRLWKCRTYPA